MGLRRTLRDLRDGWRGTDPDTQALIDTSDSLRRAGSQSLGYLVGPIPGGGGGYSRSETWHPPYAAIVCESFGHTLPDGTFPLKCITCGQTVHMACYGGGTR